MIKVGNSYRYSGCLHLHTTHSDGSKPLSQIIPIAQREKLDFLLVTDHMTIAAREEGLQGWHDSLLVGIGYEHNDPADTHHYLIFGSSKTYAPSLSAQGYVSAAKSENALGIIAHPDEVRRKKKYPPYPWTDWSVEGFDGIEIWNQMSEWTERVTNWNILPSGLHQSWSLIRPPAATLARWDERAQNGKCVGVAGADAHAFRVMIGPFTLHVFPYRKHFRALRTVVHLTEPLSQDSHVALRQLYEAIRAGQVWFGNRLLGAFEEATVEVISASRSVAITDQIKLKPDLHFKVVLPHMTSIGLIKDGTCILESEDDRLTIPITSVGLYRLQFWLGERAWFFTNHFRVIA